MGSQNVFIQISHVPVTIYPVNQLFLKIVQFQIYLIFMARSIKSSSVFDGMSSFLTLWLFIVCKKQTRFQIASMNLESKVKVKYYQNLFYGA